MKVLRTPDERFNDLPGYPFVPNYVDVPDGTEEDGTLRMHYLDEGPRGAGAVLCLHGEPSWSYLYRKMIPVLAAADHRVVAPDMIGFGRSDKPADRNDYTYERHVGWVTELLEKLDLTSITLVCQDWGGLIGLRVAAENPDRFARIVAANTGLPTGEITLSEAFMAWRKASQEMPVFPAGDIVNMGTVTDLPPEIVAAYDAPFPDESCKEGARQFPVLVPISTDDPAAEANQRAWDVYSRWEKPFLTAFSDSDPITAGGDLLFQAHIPGTNGQPHTTIKNAGHFLQEDQGEAFAQVVVDFIDAT